ncbi:polyadenylate-binding protein-interacting protein 2-like [Menidia menidia]
MKNPNSGSSGPPQSGGEGVLSGPLSSEEEPFAEFMWMENEEEFNRQVEEELWEEQLLEEELQEEEFMERCFQEMLEEEQWEWFIPSRDLPAAMVTSSLNPDAKEFTPGIQRHVM